MAKTLLRLSEEVLDAVQAGGPVVALESTLISHGLPRPANLETAIECEFVIREAGAVPATVAVLDGELRVGLERIELERLGAGDQIVKASPRDLPAAVAQRCTAATTVAGTMFIAYRAGITLMATGGIGGVHRDFVGSGDVSADLTELSTTPVTVVCSGAKSILDLPRTVEFLETMGVPVVGYGTDHFPAFLARSSGIRLDWRVESPAAAAEIMERASALGLGRGMLIVQPPPERLALDGGELENAISTALGAAQATGISGKALTPFLLDQLRQLTGGRTLAVNRALIVQNARLAAEIAVALQAARHAR